MKRTMKNLISVSYSLLRLSLIRLVHGRQLTFSPVERLSPNTQIDLLRGRLHFGKRVRMHHGTRLVVDGGSLTLGDDVALNVNCGIFCFQEITLGAGVEFGPNVLVYDHDHHVRAPGGIKAGQYQTAPVSIGDNVWVGANCVILRGSRIGQNSVIGAGCIVRGDIPANTVLTQRRENILRPIAEEE